MGEGFRNLAFLVWALCAVNGSAKAKNIDAVVTEEQNTTAPTVVFGAAKKADGGMDEFVVEQPDGAANPLGDPLQVPDPASPQVTDDENNAENAAPAAPKNNTESSVTAGENPQALGKDFQNTLMEANGMVYDVQAYPVKDFKAIGNSAEPETIYSPNVNP